jgi:phosphoribosylglycinamide formyltransferase-1
MVQNRKPAEMGERMKRIAVIASGRGSNFQAIIDSIARGAIRGVCVRLITDNPFAFAISRAQNAGIPVSILNYADYPDKTAYEQGLRETMTRTGADLFVLAGYMRILGDAIVKAFPGRMINIHPALLPCFPGLHAQRQAICYGVKISGCTVHFVDEGMDTGPIIIQACVPVFDDDDEDSLAERILEREHESLARAIQLFCEDRLIIEGRKVRVL